MLKLVKKTTDQITVKEQIGAYTYLRKADYVLLSDEEDCTQRSYIDYLVTNTLIDYRIARFLYQYLAKTYSSQDQATKDRIIDFNAIDAITIVLYYINKGFTQEKAQDLYMDLLSNHITLAAACCNTYLLSSEHKKAIISSMSIEEAVRYYNTIESLTISYSKLALFGKIYDDNQVGLLDFIWSVFDFTTNGLASYTLYPTKELITLQNNLNDILYYGLISTNLYNK